MTLKTQNYVFICLGLAMALGSLYYNHKDTQRAREASANYIEVDSSSINPENDGKLVLIKGKLTTKQTLSDTDFGIAKKAIKLERTVETYQWIENCESEKIENSKGEEEDGALSNCSYDKEWREELVDSSEYQDSRRSNPSYQAYSSKSFIASDVELGQYKIPEALLKNLVSSRLDLAEEDLTAGSYSIYENYLTNSINPERPNISDIRVSYRIFEPTEVTILAKQVGDTLEAFESSDVKLFEIATGELDGNTMVKYVGSKSRTFRNVVIVLGIACAAFGLIGKTRTGKKS